MTNGYQPKDNKEATTPPAPRPRPTMSQYASCEEYWKALYEWYKQRMEDVERVNLRLHDNLERAENRLNYLLGESFLGTDEDGNFQHQIEIPTGVSPAAHTFGMKPVPELLDLVDSAIAKATGGAG